MVLNDFSEQVAYSKQFKFAPPHQRIIATFVDFLLLYPSAFFLVSPLIREMKEEFYFGTSLGFSSLFLTTFLLVNLFVLAALTLSSMFFSSTPGQRLFSLRVRPLQQGKISFAQALQRSGGWILSLLCLGVPLFEVLTHRHRRVFYERMSETYVETLEQKWNVQAPLPYEVSLGRWIFLCFLCFGVLFGFSSWREMIRIQMEKAALMATDRQMLCEALSSQFLDRERRLNLALVLDYSYPGKYDCFSKELQSFWFKKQTRSRQDESPADSPDIQIGLYNFLIFESFSKNDYEEVCRTESQFCLLIHYFDIKRNRSASLSPRQDDRNVIVEKLRWTPDRIPLVDFILLEEDTKASRFLSALSRFRQLEELLDHQSKELGLLLDNRLIQLAWKARDVLSQAQVLSSQRGLASVPEKLSEGDQKEALQVLAMFKDRFGID
jgi:hypothetical protein